MGACLCTRPCAWCCVWKHTTPCVEVGWAIMRIHGAGKVQNPPAQSQNTLTLTCVCWRTCPVWVAGGSTLQEMSALVVKLYVDSAMSFWNLGGVSWKLCLSFQVSKHLRLPCVFYRRWVYRLRWVGNHWECCHIPLLSFFKCYFISLYKNPPVGWLIRWLVIATECLF